jgi:predicted nucleotidyltransferase
MTIEEEKPSDSARRRIIASAATGAMLEFSENNIRQVILFGSTARGEARPDSDIDVCVTINSDLSDRIVLFLGSQLTDHLHDKGFKTGVHAPMCLDLSFLSDRFFDEGAKIPGKLKDRIEDMKREGIVLYPVNPKKN